ncbi:MAG TPA: 2OG-Fe(II) oxygenase [Nitrospira sp.]|nr:2OG-Fe(II) oxygenase [Nitrospira sp.]
MVTRGDAPLDQAEGPGRSVPVEDRLARLDWHAIEDSLWERGYAKTPRLLTPEECRTLIALYDKDASFRSRIDMKRFRFGEGEYKYFGYPLPPLVQTLRETIYPRLAVVANAWAKALGQAEEFPLSHESLLARCRRSGQTKPTPLLLRYGAGDYNCLHQDLYGAVAFPLQLTVFLSRPGRDFSGGEFLLVEQRPRAQSRGDVLVPRQGEMVIFATRHRPVRGSRGSYRVTLRHGVSTVRAGSRLTLGVIFHDAR